MGLHQIVGGEAVATDLSVEENLRLFGHSVPRPAAAAGIVAALERFPRLAERRSQSAATLSGGEKQMLALAKAFITSPRLLLIDEFSLGLAPALVEELLPALARDRGAWHLDPAGRAVRGPRLRGGGLRLRHGEG